MLCNVNNHLIALKADITRPVFNIFQIILNQWSWRSNRCM